MKTKEELLTNLKNLQNKGLCTYHLDKDACGVGVVANIKGIKSNTIVKNSLKVLVNLEHRGACGCDPETGDGAGITLQIPDKFFRKDLGKKGIKLPKEGNYATGIVFLPNDKKIQNQIISIISSVLDQESTKILFLRDVPNNPNSIGDWSKDAMPEIKQIFIENIGNLNDEDFSRQLYISRKKIENKISNLKDEKNNLIIDNEFYICSLSNKIIIYKGLLKTEQLSNFYLDLQSTDIESCFGLVHSRFSTNTLGSWKLAHPYRMLAHNGEINTVRGNRNWMKAKEHNLISKKFPNNSDILPICEEDASDTASLDNVFELLFHGGRPIEHVASMMIPAAWDHNEQMDQKTKDFYQYHAGLMEPWDGPAMVAFTDGNKLGACLDRNGFRPFRYTVTKDDILVMSSETGVLELDSKNIKLKSRMTPGKGFLVDFEEGRIIDSEEIMNRLINQSPYSEWLNKNSINLDEVEETDKSTPYKGVALLEQQVAYGYSNEDINLIIRPMSDTGSQPNGSMGNDAPLAVLSDKPQNLYSYFKQLFAQVSNPPLDPIREKMVTQTSILVGKRENLLSETPKHAELLKIERPIMLNEELKKLSSINSKGINTKKISTLFDVSKGKKGFNEALENIKLEAESLIQKGVSIIILSDRGVDENNALLPSLLVAGTLHHHLIRKNLRDKVDLVYETGETREVHHFALLFGYGISAINPFIALDTIENFSDEKLDKKNLENFCNASIAGVLKTMSKMGISTLQGYMGAQQFEALGIGENLIETSFTWTASRIEGIGIEEICDDYLLFHNNAFSQSKIPSNLKLDLGGLYLWRGTGERHMWSPETISLLQKASTQNDEKTYKEFEEAANKDYYGDISIRNLLEIDYEESKAIPIDEVESEMEILKRFATGAISLGSISREAHETLAIAMNRIGARSNTGEGGEDDIRYKPDSNGDSRNSAVKQVASGRFGVTTNYLVNSKDIQIKMAQGAKPGEGGEIPGHKISEYIASIRKTTPGVELISPPPHHDIYSIEDMAQLIHDLKNVNEDARIHVKLVSEVGVGIIAAGVSKGKADVVLISGFSGGTGASPLSSIRHAGLPWELGVAETQQILVEQGLRDRITLQTDGQLKTGKDVAIATMLGAEEWGIATASLITMGCIMLRKCHLNTCSVGVATQDPELRKLFKGTPEAVVNYFKFITQSLREEMAKLGFKTVEEMVGRVDRLKQRTDIDHWKAKKIDLSRMLYKPKGIEGQKNYRTTSQDHQLDIALDNKMLKEINLENISSTKQELDFKINNINRTVGALISGKITKKYGEKGIPSDNLKINFDGSAGQSFGAFLSHGVFFNLRGDANDYFGKGLSGGKIVVSPDSKNPDFIPEENIIIGNVALYGSTGGEVYINGKAGERFCVRNSAAEAVVEGIGNHGCEYMTGGTVVVLGEVGSNFAAGMSGGIAYVYDPKSTFLQNFNSELSNLEEVFVKSKDEQKLIKLIKNHIDYTKSNVAIKIIDNWDVEIKHFKKIIPRDYAKILEENNNKQREKING
jgi:glutamate synthase domain-containing protein 2/glutamate synthase domain-containing protein 1/glutamate synthase domain-containing protein 3